MDSPGVRPVWRFCCHWSIPRRHAVLFTTGIDCEHGLIVMCCCNLPSLTGSVESWYVCLISQPRCFRKAVRFRLHVVMSTDLRKIFLFVCLRSVDRVTTHGAIAHHWPRDINPFMPTVPYLERTVFDSVFHLRVIFTFYWLVSRGTSCLQMGGGEHPGRPIYCSPPLHPPPPQRA